MTTSLCNKTSTGLYRSCAALASFSGTFDLILLEAVDFEFTVTGTNLNAENRF